MRSEAASGDIDEVVRLLQAVFTATLALQESCEKGELEKTARLLKEREELLSRAAEIRENIRSRPADAPVREQVQGRVMPLLQAIQKEDEKFVKTLNQKRKQTLEGLQQLQNRKQILAYTH